MVVERKDMKVPITLFLLIVLAALCGLLSADREVSCKPSNPNDGLSFVSPLDLQQVYKYPSPLMHTLAQRYYQFDCCGTGFDFVYWYLDDKLILPSNSNFTFKQQDQVLVWLNTVEGVANITCLLTKNNGSQLSAAMQLVVFPNCAIYHPYYSILPDNRCADPGDTVQVECEVTFYDNGCIDPFFKRTLLLFSNNTALTADPNVLVQQFPEGKHVTSMRVVATFPNISDNYLDKSYICMPMQHEYMKYVFNISRGPCPTKGLPPVQTTFQYTDQHLTTAIAVPATVGAAIVLAVCCVAIIYQREIRILWGVHVCPVAKGMKDFDGFIVYSIDAQDFVCVKLTAQLNSHFRLCLPDKDFIIGEVIPQQLTNFIQNSKRVLVVLSPGLPLSDWCELSTAIAVENKVPVIFIKQPGFDINSLADKPDLFSAIQVSSLLNYPAVEDEGNLAKFFNSLFSAMPYAQMDEQVTQVKFDKLPYEQA